MQILDTLRSIGEEEGLPFILIGGNALLAYGIARQTTDIDLIVRQGDAARWNARLSGLGYTLYHQSDAFLQFAPGSLEEWPLDLMLVDKATFDGLMAGGRRLKIGTSGVLVPKPEHLIALKLHSLKQGQAFRELKDYDDILQMLESQGIDPKSAEFRALCLKYGTGEIYDNILKNQVRK